MASHLEGILRNQLMMRKVRLQSAMETSTETEYLGGLLGEVDAALSRMTDGTFGLCEVCHEPIDGDRLAADPLLRFCLDHLTPPQQRALEQDLEMAVRIQSALLPKQDMVHAGWRAAYHYQPAGAVSGDYCDLVAAEDGNLYFMLGDVSGKGVPGSMLMAHLHALFRALMGVGLPLVQMVERASRLFCESTLASYYATLVCGKAGKDGSVELCNAGHLPSLLASGSSVRSLEATGLPLGLFCSEKFTADKVRLNRGERLVLFTDGLSETQNSAGAELGIEKVSDVVQQDNALSAHDLVRALIARASDFRSGATVGDDVTVLILERLE